MARPTVNAEIATDPRDLGVSARTRATLAFFWAVVDAFRRKAQGWEIAHVRFELRRSFVIDGHRWMMSARLGSSIGPLESGTGPRGRLLSLPYVHLWAPLMTRDDERAFSRRGSFDRLSGVFASRGYTFGWDRALGRKLGWAAPRHQPGVDALAAERAWLEQVFAPGGPQSARVPKASSESLWAVLDSFRGTRAGPWTPVGVSFVKARRLLLSDRPIGSPQLQVYVERGDQGRWTARSPLRATAGVEFFTRELEPNDRRRLRRRGWFAEIGRELPRLGFQGEWLRFRGVQPLGAFWRRHVGSTAEVLRERRRLEAVADRWFAIE